ncbi:MAG: RNA polymerase sigma factor [Planctomycetota bacterium]|jgi:hypothetical protein
MQNPDHRPDSDETRDSSAEQGHRVEPTREDDTQPPSDGDLPELDRSVDLVARFQAGDEEALAALWARYEERLRRIVRVELRAQLRPKLDPDDVLQDAYLQARKNMTSFELRSHGAILWRRSCATACATTGSASPLSAATSRGSHRCTAWSTPTAARSSSC